LLLLFFHHGQYVQIADVVTQLPPVLSTAAPPPPPPRGLLFILLASSYPSPAVDACQQQPLSLIISVGIKRGQFKKKV
jgi:hypothetical protein